MSLTIKDLKIKWSKEKECYCRQEIGSGIQSFIKDALLSSELFNLKEGKLSTSLELRENEFIHEKNAKERRRADFYIYISPEIAIPVEAECYGSINVGEKQLLNYQKDFDKHYGILTDGFEWRFYNNNVYKAFTLDDIFDNTDLFFTFWKEYIKPEFYYLSFFEKRGQLALIEETKLHVEDNRQLFFEDITKLIQSFKNKLQIEGYLEGEDKKAREKRAIELTYAYVIQFILYKTLVDNDFDDFAKEFETTVIKIHESLKDKRYKDILGIIEGISTNISKNVYRPFTKEQGFIKDKIQELYHSLENSLSDVSPWLDIFIFIKKYSYANVRNEIFGYIYENYLKELYEESKKGQYFTDPAVVNFMLDQIGYTPEIVAKRATHDPDSVSIIDPSCGSGTFLYSATDSIVKAFQDGSSEEASKKIERAVTNGVFGLDIEEFPLYLAEMNILVRMLPLIINEKYNNPIDKKIKVFKTRDSISEFMDTALRNTLSDINVEFQKSGGQMALFSEKLNLGYSSYIRDEDDLQEMKKSLENLPEVPRRRFDYVVGNPPYISYNQCAKQKLQSIEMIKNNEIKMSDIYGVNLNTVPGRIKTYPPKPNLYAFFIALGWALLKDDGKLCYIIPQTMLTANDLDVLRYHLSEYATIEKIITFQGKMFVGRGIKQNKPIPTSSLIFVVRKSTPPSINEVEIVNYEGEIKDFGSLLGHKNARKKRILQSTLRRNVDNWNFITKNKSLIDFVNEYKRYSESFDVYRLPECSLDKYGGQFYFDVGFILDKKLVSKQKEEGYYEILDFKNCKGFSVFIPESYYPNDKEQIKLTRSNQGHITLDQEYSIVWRIKNPDRFFFTDRPIIFNMGIASIITSNSKHEMFYIFSLLNSPITRLVLETYLKIESEKEFQVAILPIKKYIRVPRVGEANEHIKKVIIQLAERLIELEKLLLVDLVDFSGVLKQKFDKIGVEGNNLLLEKDGEKMELPIKQDLSLVRKAIETRYGQDELALEGETITLSELMSLPAIDFEKQKEIKDLIDDLVFCLYFNIDVPKNKISDAKFVKSLCQKNKFYEQLTAL